MPLVSEQAIRTSYEMYCAELKLNRETWSSIYDFSAMFGFSVLVGVIFMDEKGIEVSVRTERVIGWLTGLHAATMVKVIKAQRLSRWGRIRTPFIKLGHAFMFGGYSTYLVFKVLTHGN